MTDSGALEILGVEENHRRAEFDCGEETLNGYLRRYARQNHERNVARTFVAVDKHNRVLGYYSLACQYRVRFVASRLRQACTKFPVPAVRIARLAVDRSVKGDGLGENCLPMRCSASSQPHRWWRSRLRWSMPRTRRRLNSIGTMGSWGWPMRP